MYIVHHQTLRGAVTYIFNSLPVLYENGQKAFSFRGLFSPLAMVCPLLANPETASGWKIDYCFFKKLFACVCAVI